MDNYTNFILYNTNLYHILPTVFTNKITKNYKFYVISVLFRRLQKKENAEKINILHLSPLKSVPPIANGNIYDKIDNELVWVSAP